MDDTGTDLWTLAGAWAEFEGGGVSVRAGVLQISPEG